VEVQVILFREGEREPAYDSHVVPVPAASLAKHYLAGQVQTANLPPGEYPMQLIAWDRLASPKQQLAVRWARFTASAAQHIGQSIAVS